MSAAWVDAAAKVGRGSSSLRWQGRAGQGRPRRVAQRSSLGKRSPRHRLLRACLSCWPPQAISFDGGSSSKAGPPDAASQRFRQDVVHLFRCAGWSYVLCLGRRTAAGLPCPPAPPSRPTHPPPRPAPVPRPPAGSLLHGTAMQFLRSDWELANLVEHDERRLPAWVRQRRGQRCGALGRAGRVCAAVGGARRMRAKRPPCACPAAGRRQHARLPPHPAGLLCAAHAVRRPRAAFQRRIPHPRCGLAERRRARAAAGWRGRAGGQRPWVLRVACCKEGGWRWRNQWSGPYATACRRVPPQPLMPPVAPVCPCRAGWTGWRHTARTTRIPRQAALHAAAAAPAPAAPATTGAAAAASRRLATCWRAACRCDTCLRPSRLCQPHRTLHSSLQRKLVRSLKEIEQSGPIRRCRPTAVCLCKVFARQPSRAAGKLVSMPWRCRAYRSMWKSSQGVYARGAAERVYQVSWQASGAAVSSHP